MTRTLAVGVHVLCLLSTMRALSEDGPTKTAQGCFWDGSIFSAEGWKLPSLSKELIKRHEEHYRYVRKFATETRSYDSELTVVVPAEPQPSFSIPLFSIHSGQLEIRDRLVEVASIWRFEVHGKVFAYGVEYQWVAEENGKRVAVGAVTDRTYLDVKGNGQFQVITDSDPLPFAPPIPEWAMTH